MSSESKKHAEKTSAKKKSPSDAELKAEEAEKVPPVEPPEPVESDEELLDDGTYRAVHRDSSEPEKTETSEADRAEKTAEGKTEAAAVGLTVSPGQTNVDGTLGAATEPARDAKYQPSTSAKDPARPLTPSGIPVSFHSANLRVSSQTNRPPVHRQVIFDQWYPRAHSSPTVRLREFDSNVDVEGAVCMQAFPSQGFTGLILGLCLVCTRYVWLF
jgi:hypothetical protein